MPVEIENLRTRVHMAPAPGGSEPAARAERAPPTPERREDLRPDVLEVIEAEFRRLLREID